MTASRTFTLHLDDTAMGGAIVLPFDPKAMFGRVRAPVVVTVNGYRYRSTIAAMGGPPFVPLRRSHREAAHLVPGHVVDVTVALDSVPREVETPLDLAEALSASPDAQARWASLSYTHRREHVEAIVSAKKAETRARRVAAAVAALTTDARETRR